MADKKVSIRDAARELHMDVLTLRVLMQQEKINIGYAVKRDGCSRYSYYAYRKLLDAEKKRIGVTP